jgi:hypothetical protein
MFREYSETVVASVSRRSTLNEPRMASPPMASGTNAAITLPKTITSRMSSTGNEIDSALAMLALTALLMVTSVAVGPPTWAVMPSPAAPATVGKSDLIALYVLSRA